MFLRSSHNTGQFVVETHRIFRVCDLLTAEQKPKLAKKLSADKGHKYLLGKT